jgi:poly-gamma-glutamate capsule biosynthesis protein CapA/YwtB (metallophosphatase superfamily)
MASTGQEQRFATTTLVAAGDIILAEAIHDTGNALFDVIRAADIASGNLEFVLTNSDEASDKLITLKADPSIAPTIAALGFDVLTLANNHMMDFGVAGLNDCLAAVSAAGIVPVGAGATLEASLKPHITTVKGTKIAFFGVSTHLPNVSAAGLSRPGIAPLRVTTRYFVDAITAAEVPGMAPFVQTEVVAEDLDRLSRPDKGGGGGRRAGRHQHSLGPAVGVGGITSE